MSFFRVVLLCLLPLMTLAAERGGSATAPNALMAANERGLVERLGRTYAWKLIEPANADASREYLRAARHFEQQLGQLQAASKHDAELSDNYSLLGQQWSDFQAATAGTANLAQARQVLEASEDMGWIAQKGGQLLGQKGDSGVQAGILAENVAALSQRLAKIFLLQSAGLNVAFLGKDLAAARLEFDATTRQLKALPINTEATRARIGLMDMQWLFFQQALDALEANRQDTALRHNVVTTSERIYEVATELANRYQRIAVASSK
jgi:hypothetical protein